MKLRKFLAVLLIIVMFDPVILFSKPKKDLSNPNTPIASADTVYKSKYWKKINKSPQQYLREKISEAKDNGKCFPPREYVDKYIKRLDMRFMEANSPNVDKYLYGKERRQVGRSDYLTEDFKVSWNTGNGLDQMYYSSMFQYVGFVAADMAVIPLKEDTRYEQYRNCKKYAIDTYYNSFFPLNDGSYASGFLFESNDMITPAFYHADSPPFIYDEKNKRTIHYFNGFSIANIYRYPEIFWPWRYEPMDPTIGYLGMIDDDLPYDFEKNGTEGEVTPINKEAPFIYVYDFDEFRRHNSDWVTHDTMTYGYTEPGEDLEEMEKVYYGTTLKDPNILFARGLRAYMFCRMYQAKKELVSRLHPAPEWNENIGDYNINYEDKVNPANLSEEGRKIYEFSRITSVENMTALDQSKITYYFGNLDAGVEQSVKEYEKLVRESSNDLYWSLFLNFHSYDRNIADKIYKKDWTAAAKSGRELERFQILRRYYQYKALVRSPKQYDEDFRRYYNENGMSISVWAGQNSYGYFRHTSEVSQKYYFPNYDVKDKVGNTHGPDLFGPYLWPGEYEHKVKYGFSQKYSRPTGVRYMKGTASNTTGIIYAGNMTKDELYSYCNKTGKTPKQAWESALKGPFMIVSSRTYKRYGAEYFEKLAGHKLKVIDVTGGLMHSYWSVNMNHEKTKAVVKKIMNYDYFWLKQDRTTIPFVWDGKYHVTNFNPANGRWKDTNLDSIKGKQPDYVIPDTLTTKKYDHATIHPRITNNFGRIFKEIDQAIAKDEKQFPHMSQRSANYVEYFKDEPYEFPRADDITYHSLLYTHLYVNKLNRGSKYEFLVPEFYKMYVPRSDELYYGLWGYYYYGGSWNDRDNKRVYEFCDREVRKRSPRGIEVFARIWRDKARGVIDEIKSQPGDFTYNLQKYLADNIPWMAYNPNLFMCYYKNIRWLKILDDELYWGPYYDDSYRFYRKDGSLWIDGQDYIPDEPYTNNILNRKLPHAFADRLEGIGDGVMPTAFEYSKESTVFRNDIVMDMVALTKPDSSSDKPYLRYMYGYCGYMDNSYDTLAVAAGRMRKRLDSDKEELFPITELAVSTIVMSTSGLNPYYASYYSMKSPTGIKVRGTRAMSYGTLSCHGEEVSRIYSEAMPGMLIFPNITNLPTYGYEKVESYKSAYYEYDPYRQREPITNTEVYVRDKLLSCFILDGSF